MRVKGSAVDGGRFTATRARVLKLRRARRNGDHRRRVRGKSATALTAASTLGISTVANAVTAAMNDDPCLFQASNAIATRDPANR